MPPPLALHLKCKFPSLLDAKEDEELFYAKERVVKIQEGQPSRPSVRLFTHYFPDNVST